MKEIEQAVTLPASPASVYDALVNAERHAAFTGAPAEIDASVGGRFRCYGGRIEGIFLELVPGKRIVQAWRPANFPEGAFTIATYAIEPDGQSTTLRFTQTSVPDSAYDHLSTGWQERYWQPLRSYLEA
jgi:activator of HSP90 ATPase